MRDRSAPFKASSPFSIGPPLSGPRESRSRSRDGYPPAVVTIRLSPEEKFSFSNFYPIVSCSSLRWMLIFFLSVLIRYRRRVSYSVVKIETIRCEEGEGAMNNAPENRISVMELVLYILQSK